MSPRKKDADSDTQNESKSPLSPRALRSAKQAEGEILNYTPKKLAVKSDPPDNGTVEIGGQNVPVRILTGAKGAFGQLYELGPGPNPPRVLKHQKLDGLAAEIEADLLNSGTPLQNARARAAEAAPLLMARGLKNEFLAQNLAHSVNPSQFPRAHHVSANQLSMDRVFGRTLTDVQGSLASLNVAPNERAAVVRELTRQALTATRTLHDVNVSHRDLHPGNMMLGTNGVLKVIDFGTAKAHGMSDAQLATLRITSGGTQFFASKNNLAVYKQEGGSEYTHQDDVFAVGRVASFLAGGYSAVQRADQGGEPPNSLRRTNLGTTFGRFLRDTTTDTDGSAASRVTADGALRSAFFQADSGVAPQRVQQILRHLADPQANPLQ